MIYITGDTHGDFTRINDFCEEKKTTTENDIMVILGDAGLNFYLNKSDIKRKNEVAKIPITLFMIHGNHEERPYNVPGYEKREWNGGIVYVHPDFPNQLFAKDGEIYNLNDKSVIVIGGAYSVDKDYRLSRHIPWFESEQPSDEIKAYVESQLGKVNWKVDVVFSHTCPFNYMPIHLFLPFVDQSKVDNSTEDWLQTIEDKLNYRKWYFGHYHDNWKLKKFQMLYKSIIEFK